MPKAIVMAAAIALAVLAGQRSALGQQPADQDLRWCMGVGGVGDDLVI